MLRCNQDLMNTESEPVETWPGLYCLLYSQRGSNCLIMPPKWERISDISENAVTLFLFILAPSNCNLFVTCHHLCFNPQYIQNEEHHSKSKD